MFSLKETLSAPSSPSPNDANQSKVCAGLGLQKRLTRQRKFRYAIDMEIGLRPENDRSYPLPVSPGSASGFQSLTNNFAHRSCLAVPRPLPLPEFGYSLKQNDDFRFSNKKYGDGRDRNGDGLRLNPALGSHTVHQSTDHVARKSGKSPSYYHRMVPEKLNTESVHKFQFNVPSKSAPTSGFSSPTHSSQRFRTVDILHSFAEVPQTFQASSALNARNLDRLAVSSAHLHSIFHGPATGSFCQKARNPTCVTFLHHKSLPENSTAWPEGNSPANMHPLPLPPAVTKPSLSTPTHHLMEKPDGTLMKSQWKKGKLIGRGTYGSVYLATNCITGATCALKEVDLIPDDPKSAECIKQLEQEIKVLQHVKHPNIVQYYGCEVVDDRFCIYLEYVYPGSISKFVREQCRAVTESVVRNFTRHILSGLAFLHSSNIIHRDIKGANLLVDASGVVKLADFGLAKHFTGHVMDLSLKGSPHWMAPEVLQVVLRNNNNCELAYGVDIWSVGCTVIEMFCGKPPWSEFQDVQAMFQVLHKSPSIPDALSSEGKDFLKLCFQRNPVDRPSAVTLLNHRFLRSSGDQDVSVSLQELSGVKLMDKSQGPRDWSGRGEDLMLISPDTRFMRGKELFSLDAHRRRGKELISPDVQRRYEKEAFSPDTPHRGGVKELFSPDTLRRRVKELFSPDVQRRREKEAFSPDTQHRRGKESNREFNPQSRVETPQAFRSKSSRESNCKSLNNAVFGAGDRTSVSQNSLHQAMNSATGSNNLLHGAGNSATPVSNNLLLQHGAGLNSGHPNILWGTHRMEVPYP